MISPFSSIPTARVQLGRYAENHGEHYICVEGRVLLEEEEQEKKAEKEAFSSSEAALLLVSTKNRDLWPAPIRSCH